MTGWAFEAAGQAGLKGRLSLAGEEGKTNLTGDGSVRKDISVAVLRLLQWAAPCQNKDRKRRLYIEKDSYLQDVCTILIIRIRNAKPLDVNKITQNSAVRYERSGKLFGLVIFYD